VIFPSWGISDLTPDPSVP